MKLIFGTRGSALALRQTNQVIDLLRTIVPTLQAEIKIIKTLGDTKQGTAQAGISDKQDWIQGLDTALVNSEIDIAIHSAKDVPVDIHPASQIFPVGLREKPNDLLISRANQYRTLQSLPSGSVIGTASLRRKAQILFQRPDLKVIPHRGNINTRIETFQNNPNLSAIILAEAGMQRMGFDCQQFSELSTSNILPAVNQGCVVAHIMLHRKDLIELMYQVVDPEVRICFAAERQCINLLEANCHSAVGVFAQMVNDQLVLDCRILMPDGSEMIESSIVCEPKLYMWASEQVAEDLVLQGASRIIAESNKIRAGWDK